MNVVYNCDDGYAVHTAVSITSLFENDPDEPEISIFILGNGISESSCRKLQEICDRYRRDDRQREITVIDLREFETALKLLFGKKLDAGRFTVTALARIFAPQHLPEEIERYLYLDCDTVVRRSLRKLWETDLGGMVCGMAAEPTIYPEVREYLGLDGSMPYYNTGMMLVDRSSWEREGITGNCVEYYRSKEGRLPFSDQDILNYVLRGKVRTLWQGWDFFANYHYRSYRSLCMQAEWFAGVQIEAEYEDARKDPPVVHYSGDERPWFRGNHNPYRTDYERYLAMTPWAGTPKTPGRELHLFLYHLMNLATALCPAIRIWISGRYYRNYRKKLGY
ncbi:MAG: glycosyltransferase family 8 protein [Lachnospiraceae bacterium]|nr:glycosyltransferase family 8 protein [Lachnospiraceae bacterium]